MWDLPGPGHEPMSPALAGGFLTTVPSGKPLQVVLNNSDRRHPRPVPNFNWMVWMLCHWREHLLWILGFHSFSGAPASQQLGLDPSPRSVVTVSNCAQDEPGARWAPPSTGTRGTGAQRERGPLTAFLPKSAGPWSPSVLFHSHTNCKVCRDVASLPHQGQTHMMSYKNGHLKEEIGQ